MPGHERLGNTALRELPDGYPRDSSTGASQDSQLRHQATEDIRQWRATGRPGWRRDPQPAASQITLAPSSLPFLSLHSSRVRARGSAWAFARELVMQGFTVLLLGHLSGELDEAAAAL